jgi:hypothetical protein
MDVGHLDARNGVDDG